MNILLWVLLGIIAGWLASVIMKTNASQGVIGDIVMGVLGAVVGGMLFNLFGAPGVTGINLYSIMVATIGAIVLIALGRMIMGRRA